LSRRAVRPLVELQPLAARPKRDRILNRGSRTFQRDPSFRHQAASCPTRRGRALVQLLRGDRRVFYHSNFRSPHWLKYFIQTPELHSVHHELEVHKYNFADLPMWDRLFGTYKDADDFAAQCGFPRHNERNLGRMLTFEDAHSD
jgi:hypothetical protein